MEKANGSSYGRNVIPIVDLKIRLGPERRAHDKNTRIFVVELEGNAGVGYCIAAVGKLEDRLLTLFDLENLVLN